MFNSALIYELACLKVYAEPLLFGIAKDGHHTKLPPVRMRRCRHAALTLEEPDYPIQADGEPVVASRIEVDVLPAVLEVWHPTR